MLGRLAGATLASIIVFLVIFLVMFNDQDIRMLVPQPDPVPPRQSSAVPRLPTGLTEGTLDGTEKLSGVLPTLNPLETPVPRPTVPPGFHTYSIPVATGSQDRVEVRSRQSQTPDDPSAAKPTHIKIGRIGIEAEILPVAHEGNNIGVTNDAKTVGWYEDGPVPGSSGVAVLAGHRDWAGAKGAFYDLNLLKPGDTLDVKTTRGTKTFVVWQSERYPTANAPSGAIMRESGPASLVLISCEGSFDPLLHDYSHRRVVLAVEQNTAKTLNH